MGTTCDIDGKSTLSDLSIQPGWWRISEKTDEIRQCTHGSLACRGGLNYSEGYCTDGHQGILCAVCSDGYFFYSEESKCLSCDDLQGLGELWLSSPALILFSILFVVLLAYIVSMACVSDRSAVNKRRQRSVWVEQKVDQFNDSAFCVLELFSQMKGGGLKLKALTSFFQIVQNVGVRIFSEVLFHTLQ